MDRKDLIRLYLDAETTCEQEQELAASFATTPPADEEEMAVYKMIQAVKPIELPELPEAGDEYDRMVRPSRVRPFYTWGLSLAGVAAAIAAVVLFTGKPKQPGVPATPQNDYTQPGGSREPGIQARWGRVCDDRPFPRWADCLVHPHTAGWGQIL